MKGPATRTCPALCVVAFLPISGLHVGAVAPGEKPALQRHLPHTHPRETWERRADGTVGIMIISQLIWVVLHSLFVPKLLQAGNMVPGSAKLLAQGQ